MPSINEIEPLLASSCFRKKKKKKKAFDVIHVSYALLRRDSAVRRKHI